MQFRDHPGVQGKRDAYPFDPRLLKIEPSFNVRDLDATDEREDLDELKESIRANGVRTPLEVRLVDEDVFVTAGHRRHKVVMELIAEGEPIKAIPVIPEPKNTTAEDRVINLVISNSGKPLKPLEVAEVVRRLVAFGWEKQNIAKRLGKSASAVSGYLDMIAMPEPVKEQVRENAISATEAARLVKGLAKGVDPAEAAALIKANKEENKRLGVGVKSGHKVTAKTLKRDRPKAPVAPKEEPKPDQLSDEEKATRAQALANAQQRETDAAIFDEQNPGAAAIQLNDPYLTEMLNRERATASDLPSGLPATPESPATFTPLCDETLPADRGLTMDEVNAEIARIAREANAPAPPVQVYSRASTIDALLLSFIGANLAELAAMHDRLNREHDEALANDTHRVAQLHLIHAADAIGSLRFPDEWEGAKGNAELAAVA